MATFISFGSDVLNNASISSNSTGGNNNAGTVTVQTDAGSLSGKVIWDADYIVEYSIPDAHIGADDEFTSSAGVDGIVVYANAEDYNAGIALYTYVPQNPGQVATIQQSVDGVGDTYIRFNANILVSSDAGAPTLSNLFVAPNSNITQTTSNTVVFSHETDVDYNGDGVLTGVEIGNGNFNLSSGVPSSAICYQEGTLISCLEGMQRVEDLKEGDLVLTMDNGFQPIVWNGRTVYSSLDLLANPKLRPISISAKRTSTGRDLRVTRQHRMLDSRGFFVKAADIEKLPHSNTRIAKGVRQVAYHHLLLPRHEVIFANGLASESFYPGPEALRALGRIGRAKVEARVPELANRSVHDAYGPMARPVEKRKNLDGEWRPVVMVDIESVEMETGQKAVA